MEEEITPQEKPEGKKIHKVRTFKDDLAHAVKQGGISSSRMAIKEQQRRIKMEQADLDSKPKASNFFMIVFSLVFVVVALGIFVVIKINPSLSFLNKEKVVEEKVEVELFSNKTKVVIKPSINRNTMLSDFDSLFSEKEAGKLQAFEFYSQDGEMTTPVTTSEMFNYLNISPEKLETSIKKMIYGLNGEKTFLLIEMRNFENTFSGIFNWEKGRMIANLESIFHNIREIVIEEEIPNPEYVEVVDEEEEEVGEPVVTEEETIEENVIEDVEVPKTITIERRINWRELEFVDEILFNKDSRVLRNESGEVGLVYTFIDNNYLLISSDIPTVKVVIDLIANYYIANN